MFMALALVTKSWSVMPLLAIPLPVLLPLSCVMLPPAGAVVIAALSTVVVVDVLLLLPLHATRERAIAHTPSFNVFFMAFLFKSVWAFIPWLRAHPGIS